MASHNHYNDSDFSRGQLAIDFQVRRATEELRRKGEHVLTAAKKALRDGADIIAADMRRRVPIKSGKLKSSINVESLENGAVYRFSANARNPKDNFLYAPIVEFATWRNVKGKRHRKKKTAFMYPAFDARRQEVNSLIKDAINSAIERGS